MELRIVGQPGYAYTGNRPHQQDQPVLVFIHGAGMDHSVWLLQSRYFAHHGYSVLAVDLPGHGRSGGEALDNIPALANWTAALLDAVGAERAALVGHSMGSLVALETAARYPGRVRALALLGSAVPMPVGPPLLAAAEQNDHAAIDMITLWGHAERAQFGGHRVPGLWMTGSAERLLERAAPGVLYRDLRACNNYRHGLESAARVQCPGCLILGNEDRMTPPRAARQLAETLARAQTVLLDDCGHMMMVEKPEQTLDALIAAGL